MEELKSPAISPENLCNTRLSQEDMQKPLSPILGSGQSLKKLFKNKKERHKRDSKRIVQKLENMNSKDETRKSSFSDKEKNMLELKDASLLKYFQNLENSTSNIDTISGLSNSRVSLEYNSKEMPEILLDRIKTLEDFNTKRTNIIKVISFNKSVYVGSSKVESDSDKTNEQPEQIHIEKSPKINEEVSFQKHSKEKTTGIFQTEENSIVCFQKGTGKDINISDTDLKTSAMLFNDILYPSNNQSSRKNKFNFLSRYGSTKKHEITSKIPHNQTGHTKKNESFKIISETSPIKNSKNIFEGKKCNDLKLLQHGFKATSVSLKEQINKISEVQNKTVKDIFEGENFDDLRLVQGSGFQTALVGLKSDQNETFSKAEHQENLQKSLKNIFERRNFDDLKLFKNSGFNAASINNLENRMMSTKSDTRILYEPSLQKSVRNIFKNGPKQLQNKNFEAVSVNLNGQQINKNPEGDTQEKLQHKPVENIFEGDDVKVSYNSGFNSMSLKDEGCSSANGTKKSFKTFYEGENVSNLNFVENVSFKSASLWSEDCKNTEIKTKEIYENFFGLKNSNKQITRGSKRAISTENNIQEALDKKSFRNIFEGENFDDLNLKSSEFHNPNNLQSARCTMTKLNNRSKNFKNIFESENFDDLNLVALGSKFQNHTINIKRNLLQKKTFESPYRTPIKNIEQTTDNQSPENNFYGFNNDEKEIALNISESHCGIVNIIEDRFNEVISQENYEKPLINLCSIENLRKKLLINNRKSNVECDLAIGNIDLGKIRKFPKLDSDHISICHSSIAENKIGKQNMGSSTPGTPLQNNFLKRAKKRLGCHFSPTIQISETVLKKAKLMFEDVEYKTVETSTPIKFERNLTTSLACDLTPVPGVRKNLEKSFLEIDKNNSGLSKSFNKSIILNETLVKSTARFGLNKPSEGDVNVWLEILFSERRLLEEKLRTIDERQTILTNQRTMLEFSARGKKRIVPGVLYKAKSQKGRVHLKDFGAHTWPRENTTNNNSLQHINPQNAYLVHFYVENTRQSHIETQDGAVIIPSIEGKIGISEIEHSFKVMEAVDPNLIPKGWIQNHYKWIIWKLASYERMFPDRCEGCLGIENVIQQLKYRYDIEIDQVKRSALHKIFEKDDCPQRRLVLCVSQIRKINNTYELELTDGWYSIRTVIDPPLCGQIVKGRIKLGVKLMTYGAELINCEGCHPLEATDLVSLKINYNSTRRAAWWMKLGCQKNSGPFLIPLSSIIMEGGKIGCIRCFVVRVYPVKYMEKCGDKNVWRNKKAEERREQEFYNEKINSLKKNSSNIYSESSKNTKEILKCIKNIDDPVTLYNILQESIDPESIQENLSSSQKTLLYNYTLNKSAPDQPKVLNKSSENTKMLHERTVSSLLTIKIIDAHSEPGLIYDFRLWNPQESHLQELREEEVLTIFNVSCSPKWGLSANRTTQIKTEQKPQDEQFQKFRRKVTLIENLQYFSKEKRILNEFDTVGIVVKKRVDGHQQVWLTDTKENLLMIQIYDSPKNILVLDAVDEGQIGTVCNLAFKNYYQEYCFAVADHFVVFSKYSQYGHLQKAAEELEKELACIDVNTLLEACKNKVNKIEIKWDCKTSKSAWDIDDMDCSQITTTDLALLECVDKLI